MTSNIPAGAIVALEKKWNADVRFSEWFDFAVSEIAEALRKRDDVADAINTAWLADDEYGVDIEYSDIAEAVLKASDIVRNEEMKEAA